MKIIALVCRNFINWKHEGWYWYIFIILFVVCTCNSLGSVKSDDSACNNKCCNDDGTCKCSIGYTGDDCNICDAGYYVSANVNGENTCTRKYYILQKIELGSRYMHCILFIRVFKNSGDNWITNWNCRN